MGVSGLSSEKQTAEDSAMANTTASSKQIVLKKPMDRMSAFQLIQLAGDAREKGVSPIIFAFHQATSVSVWTRQPVFSQAWASVARKSLRSSSFMNLSLQRL